MSASGLIARVRARFHGQYGIKDAYISVSNLHSIALFDEQKLMILWLRNSV
jgi:hypothetical protein